MASYGPQKPETAPCYLGGLQRHAPETFPDPLSLIQKVAPRAWLRLDARPAFLEITERLPKIRLVATSKRLSPQRASREPRSLDRFPLRNLP